MDKEQIRNCKKMGTNNNKPTKKIADQISKVWNFKIRLSGENLLYPACFFLGLLFYLESILHFLIYRRIDIKMIYPIIFAIPFGLIMTFISGLCSEMINKIVLWCTTIILCFVFQAQLVYYSVFKVYFSFQTMGMAGDAVSDFGEDVITAIKANIGGLILLAMPLIILVLMVHKQIDYNRRGMKEQGLVLGSSILFHVIAVIALLLFGKGDYTPYDLYYNSQVHDLCGKQLGLITMTRLELTGMVAEKKELVLTDTLNLEKVPNKVPAQQPNTTKETIKSENTKPNVAPALTLLPATKPIDTSPNVLDIDFNILAEQEQNSTIKTLHQYFATVTPTNKNEYTGMFQGYNLILITAEGFCPYAVSKQKTPTLYRMIQEGFVFNNFYTALWQTSTSDGEYVALTGLIPSGTRSMYKGRRNLWPFSFGNQFNLLGVESKAYHNHSYTYYQRNETHPNLGYQFKAKGNGLKLDNPDPWPASDLDMINNTVKEYISEDQFHVYYLTVSGHMNYTFEGNSMSNKNRGLVEDLPYSEEAKAYIACQMELDMALERLIKKLEKAGKADHTVIALSADHYPYGLEKLKLNELAGHEIDPNFEIFKNNFILWNAGMKERIIVDKPCSSLDILPTLSNLFGLEYDSRLLMGQDVLSDAAPLAIFSNRSFISDKVMYNSETGKVIDLTGEELPKDYINNLNKVIKNKFMVSESILQEDYYRYLFP